MSDAWLVRNILYLKDDFSTFIMYCRAVTHVIPYNEDKSVCDKKSRRRPLVDGIF